MPEPDLVDEPTLDPEAVPGSASSTGLPAEDPVLAPLQGPEHPLDQPVMPDPTPQPENYHVAIWDTPVTFACLRCAARGLTHDEMVYHLSAAHGEAPVPTPLAAQYTPPQTPPATGEEALARLSLVLSSATAGDGAATKERDDDERPPGDGDAQPGAEPGTERGAESDV